MNQRIAANRSKILRVTALGLGLTMTSLALTACQTSDVIYNGFVADDETLALAPVGSSKEQVLLSLGTPSATATFDNEVLYYVSQKRERSVAFMKPKLVQQTVLAYYIGKDGNVERVGNYTLKDGKVFDMISRTTPTAGKDITFLQQILSGGASKSSITQALGG